MALLCFQWIRAIDVEETFDSNVGVNEFLFVLYFQISLPCTVGDSREHFFLPFQRRCVIATCILIK